MTNRSRVLREANIASEVVLWRKLRNRQLGGFKFVRQDAIGDYFADFVCRELKLIVEVDGGTHSSEMELASDVRRQRQIEALGYKILRIWNEDVRKNMDGVLETIYAELNARRCEREAAPHPSPLPVKDGERE